MNKKMMLMGIALVVFMLLGALAAGCDVEEGDNGEETADDEVNGDDQAAEPESEWEITVTAGEEDTVVTIEEIREMDQTTIEVERDEITEYTGVLLKDILELAGVTETEMLTLQAADGFEADLEGAEVIFSEKTILALQINGEDWEEKSAPIRLIAPDASGRSWVGQLQAIMVE